MVLLLVGGIALIFGGAGCAKKAPVADTTPPMDSEFSDGRDGAEDSYAGDTNTGVPVAGIAPVYFALDSSQITSDYQAALSAGAGMLKSSTGQVVIEGHCDERGSEEYNFALGERRASSVRKYLYNLGVPMNQMEIVSYGEARPAVSGYGESAWRLNRRAEFKVR